MRIGYARVSTVDQNPDLQLKRLKTAGCERIIIERASGARTDRPELTRLLHDILREGDTLVVWNSTGWHAPSSSSSRPPRI